MAYETILRHKLAHGEPLEKSKEPEKITFSEFARQWFDGYVKTNNKLSEVRSKKSILCHYLVPFFGNYELNDVTNYEIEKFKTERQKQGLSNKTINNTLACLGKCLRTAQEWEMLKSAPKIKRLRVAPQKFDYLSPEESDKLLEYADGFLKDMILLALRTGLRFGEIIALTWKEVNFRENVLTVSNSVARGHLGSTKSNKIRYVPLGDETRQMLIIRNIGVDKNDLIFPNQVGRFQLQEHCRRWLHKICEKAGMRKIGWHVFRHTFASRLAENGISMRTIQELLGHSDTATTMRYAHLSPLVLREAISTLEKPKIIEFCPPEGTLSEIKEKNIEIDDLNKVKILANSKTKTEY